MEKLKTYFRFAEHQTDLRTEVRAGFTTFITVAYILFVNPTILSSAIPLGDNGFAQLMTATALAGAVGCLFMGLYARLPFALAPGMGLNAYFAYTVVGSMGVPWQAAFGAVLISGIIFLIISAAGARQALVEAVPHSVKISSAVGIGLFLAFIGAKNAGLVVDHPATLVSLGSLRDTGTLLGVLGLLILGLLLVLRVKGAILIGILTISAIAIAIEAPVFSGKAFSGFSGSLIQAPVWPSDLFLSFDLKGALEMGILGVVFIFFFVDFFDTAGTFFGLSQKVDLFSQGSDNKVQKGFLSDAIATIFGSLIGTTSTTTYVESAAGIEEGGKTGLVAVVVGALFLLSIFLWPVASMVPAVATAPALILVGAFMMGGMANLDWSDHLVAIPAFLTIISMPLTFSIANGISFGIISHVLLHLLSGRGKSVNILAYVLAAALLARFAFMAGG